MPNDLTITTIFLGRYEQGDNAVRLLRYETGLRKKHLYCLVKPVCTVKCVFYITNEMQLTQRSLLLSALYMFWAVFPSIIRSL
jgi:hypothetical protein